jgi:hypothetical protein
MTMHHPGIPCRGNAESHPRGCLKIESETKLVIPGRVEDANPESRDSGFDAEPVIGRAFARPVGIAPEWRRV